MKKLSIFVAVALAVAAQAQMRSKGARGADGGESVAKGKDAYCHIDTMSRCGTNLATPPNLQANGKLLPPLGGKPRQWIVLEAKYSTMAKWQDELTFTWHVLLDSTKAREKDPKNPPAKYSYYNVQVRYVDIKQGPHMASVCMPPSIYERFGEVCTITLIISNKEGDLLAVRTENNDSNVRKAGEKWWENDKFMNWEKNSKPMIERRQGLVDRSKTPFWLVNNADYELVQ